MGRLLAVADVVEVTVLALEGLLAVPRFVINVVHSSRRLEESVIHRLHVIGLVLESLTILLRVGSLLLHFRLVY